VDPAERAGGIGAWRGGANGLIDGHPTSARPARRPRILGIGGTTVERSRTLLALETALDLAAKAGAETRLVSIHALDLPLFNPSWPLARYPATLPWLLDEVRAADGLILCSPTYHGTVSGAVKNALDSLIFLGQDVPPYLGGKPVGLMAYGGLTAMGVLDALHHCVRGLKGVIAPTQVAVHSSTFDSETNAITEARLLSRLATMVDEVVTLAGRLAAAPSTEGRLSQEQT
jgi:FMN reductase